MPSCAGRRTTRAARRWLAPRSGAELLTQHAAQTHVEPQLTTIALFLNTRVAALRRHARAPRAERAASIAAPSCAPSAARSAATPTCQILPPNFPGYVRYCPYDAPDLRTARRLVAASGTRGMRVTVWSSRVPRARRTDRRCAPAPPRLPRRAEGDPGRCARQLLRADLRFAHARAGGHVLLGADYPAPSNFLAHLLSCAAFQPASANNLNLAEFCRPGDRRPDALGGAHADGRTRSSPTANGPESTTRSSTPPRGCRSTTPAPSSCCRGAWAATATTRSTAPSSTSSGCDRCGRRLEAGPRVGDSRHVHPARLSADATIGGIATRPGAIGLASPRYGREGANASLLRSMALGR